MYYLLFSLSSILSVAGSSVFFKRYQLRAGTGLWATASYLFTNGVISALIPLCILLVSGTPIQATPCSLLYAFSLVVVSTINNYFMLRAFEVGQVAIANTFSVIGSMVLSCVWGVLFLHEELGVMQILGIALIFVAVLLVSRKGHAGTGRGQGFYLLMIFLAAGGINILSKMHQVETNFATVDTMNFSMWVGALRAILFGVLMPFMGKQRREETGVDAKAWVDGAIYSAIGGSTYIVTLAMVKLLPITLTTPLSTGISLVFSAVFAWLFHRERLNRAEIATIVLSLVGVLFIIS